MPQRQRLVPNPKRVEWFQQVVIWFGCDTNEDHSALD